MKNLLPMYFTFDTVDIATTIAALLGIPVPRQSEGSFISPLISTLVPASKWYPLYFDLYKQKQSLVKALLNQWNQLSLKSHYDSLLVDDIETNANITVLNANIDALSALIEISKAHRIIHITMKNLIFSFFIAVFGVLMICIVFHRSTFLDLHALLPSSVVCVWTNGWKRLLLDRCSMRNITEYKSVPTTYIQRMHRIFLIFALMTIGIWWLLMMILLFGIFAKMYRPTNEWRWQLTLFNSAHDAYVLMIGICIFGSFIVTVFISLTMWLIFRLKHINMWLSQFLQLSSNKDMTSVSHISGSIIILSQFLYHFSI